MNDANSATAKAVAGGDGNGDGDGDGGSNSNDNKNDNNTTTTATTINSNRRQRRQSSNPPNRPVIPSVRITRRSTGYLRSGHAHLPFVDFIEKHPPTKRGRTTTTSNNSVSSNNSIRMTRSSSQSPPRKKATTTTTTRRKRKQRQSTIMSKVIKAKNKKNNDDNTQDDDNDDDENNEEDAEDIDIDDDDDEYVDEEDKDDDEEEQEEKKEHNEENDSDSDSVENSKKRPKRNSRSSNKDDDDDKDDNDDDDDDTSISKPKKKRTKKRKRGWPAGKKRKTSNSKTVEEIEPDETKSNQTTSPTLRDSQDKQDDTKQSSSSSSSLVDNTTKTKNVSSAKDIAIESSQQNNNHNNNNNNNNSSSNGKRTVEIKKDDQSKELSTANSKISTNEKTINDSFDETTTDASNSFLKPKKEESKTTSQSPSKKNNSNNDEIPTMTPNGEIKTNTNGETTTTTTKNNQKQSNESAAAATITTNDEQSSQTNTTNNDNDDDDDDEKTSEQTIGKKFSISNETSRKQTIHDASNDLDNPGKSDAIVPSKVTTAEQTTNQRNNDNDNNNDDDDANEANTTKSKNTGDKNQSNDSSSQNSKTTTATRKETNVNHKSVDNVNAVKNKTTDDATMKKNDLQQSTETNSESSDKTIDASLCNQLSDSQKNSQSFNNDGAKENLSTSNEQQSQRNEVDASKTTNDTSNMKLELLKDDEANRQDSSTSPSDTKNRKSIEKEEKGKSNPGKEMLPLKDPVANPNKNEQTTTGDSSQNAKPNVLAATLASEISNDKLDLALSETVVEKETSPVAGSRKRGREEGDHDKGSFVESKLGNGAQQADGGNLSSESTGEQMEISGYQSTKSTDNEATKIGKTEQNSPVLEITKMEDLIVTMKLVGGRFPEYFFRKTNPRKRANNDDEENVLNSYSPGGDTMTELKKPYRCENPGVGINRIRLVPPRDNRDVNGIGAIVLQRLILQYGTYEGDAKLMPKPNLNMTPLEMNQGTDSGDGMQDMTSSDADAESSDQKKAATEQPNLVHNVKILNTHAFKSHRRSSNETTVYPPVLLEKSDPSDDIPMSFSHLPLNAKITVLDRKRGKVYSGRKAVPVKDLASVLEANAALEPIIPPPDASDDSDGMNIVREGRSAPGTLVCGNVRRQRSEGPEFQHGEIVRVTQGKNKNEIGSFEKSLPGGWSEIRRLRPGAPSTFWVQSSHLTNKPRNTKPKRRTFSAKQLKSLFKQSVDELLPDQTDQGHGRANDRKYAGEGDKTRREMARTLQKYL